MYPPRRRRTRVTYACICIWAKTCRPLGSLARPGPAIGMKREGKKSTGRARGGEGPDHLGHSVSLLRRSGPRRLHHRTDPSEEEGKAPRERERERKSGCLASATVQRAPLRVSDPSTAARCAFLPRGYLSRRDTPRTLARAWAPNIFLAPHAPPDPFATN
jgi:hypothetical protein